MKMHEWNAVEKNDAPPRKKGDILVTNKVNSAFRDARDRGVHVVGIPVNYIDNEWTTGRICPCRTETAGCSVNVPARSSRVMSPIRRESWIARSSRDKILPSSRIPSYHLLDAPVQVADKVKNGAAKHNGPVAGGHRHDPRTEQASLPAPAGVPFRSRSDRGETHRGGGHYH